MTETHLPKIGSVKIIIKLSWNASLIVNDSGVQQKGQYDIYTVMGSRKTGPGIQRYFTPLN